MAAVIPRGFKVYKVGDRAAHRFGAHIVTGTVVEDFGGLAPGGEQMVTVEYRLDEDTTTRSTTRVGLLVPVPRAARRPRVKASRPRPRSRSAAPRRTRKKAA